LKRYFCKKNSHSFSVDHREKPLFWIPYIDGVPFRKLADHHDSSPAKVFRQVEEEMEGLPENTWLSREFCSRWSGRLVVDGKYVAVKGYDRKIPFIYCIDFLTHDIPVGILVPSENEWAFTELFNLLHTIRYPLQIVICDDASALKPALHRVYPSVPIQLCHNHYLENVRQLLHVRTEEKYRTFFAELRGAFSPKNHFQKRNGWLRSIFLRYASQDPMLEDIMADVDARYDFLFAFDANFMRHCPHTTNMIESYNSHLQGRLKSVKGFQSFHSASRFLNAWMLRRRTKTFTDCEKPFTHLNGHAPIEQSLKKGADLASVLSLLGSKKHLK
jgi:transposase-like protein